MPTHAGDPSAVRRLLATRRRPGGALCRGQKLEDSRWVNVSTYEYPACHEFAYAGLRSGYPGG